jgi:hypothetical protein
MPQTAAPQLPEDRLPDGRIEGRAHVFFAFDIGFQVDLDRATNLVAAPTRAGVVRTRRRAPSWFDYAVQPLRLTADGAALEVEAGAHRLRTEAAVEIVVHDFGAALAIYRLPLPPHVTDLPDLAVALFDPEQLAADAAVRVRAVAEAIAPAIERPRIANTVEDYVVFAVSDWGGGDPADFAAVHDDFLARAVEAETGPLSREHAERAISGRMSYATDDLAIVDWNAAILFDANCDDVLAVLQHANLELLQLRLLDGELDQILDHADETMHRLARRRLWPTFQEARLLQAVATAQTDAAVLFEGVNNAIKILGNQYLARLYRLAAERLDLPAWQHSVQRKLAATESLYQKMSDVASGRRLETLEWVIILLITASIILPLTPWYGGGH